MCDRQYPTACSNHYIHNKYHNLWLVLGEIAAQEVKDKTLFTVKGTSDTKYEHNNKYTRRRRINNIVKRHMYVFVHVAGNG